MACALDRDIPAARLLPQLRAVLEIVRRETPAPQTPESLPAVLSAGTLPSPPADPTPVSIRYHPFCVPKELAHPGFEEPVANVCYERVETFGDGTTRTQFIDGGDLRREAAGLGVCNEDFVDADLVAHDLACIYDGRLAYCHELRAWFVWNGMIWRRDTSDAALKLIRLLIVDLATDNRRAQAYAGTAGFLKQCERVARSEPALKMRAAAFDADPMRLGTPGGTVDLASGALAPATPANRITRVTAVAPAQTSDCPRWRRFLDEAMGGDAGMVGFLQRFCGYALTGETSEHALLYGLGDGGNGKSVFVNTLRGILGDYAAVAASNFLAQAANSRRTTAAEIARLAEARLVTAAETEAGQVWAEERVKLLTGGDAVAAGAGRDAVALTPRFKLVVVGNHMPALRDVDAAMRRRLCVVPFATRPAAPDRDLAAKLKVEWPAILRWMIQGCLIWRAEGLGRPAAVVAATDEYFAGQDIVGQFLMEACVVGPKETETARALYAAWCTYAKAAGEAPGSQKLFAAKLERRGMTRARTIHARLYRGLRLLRSEDREREATA